MNSFNVYYYIIYLLFALIVLVLTIECKYRNKDYPLLNNIIIILFTFLFFILFSTRDPMLGVDTIKYINTYNNFKGFRYLNIADVKDIGIYITYALGKVMSIKENNILWLFSLIYILPIGIAFKRINVKTKSLLFFSFISFFFFISMGMNIIRQGIAASFFLLAVVLSQENKNKASIYTLYILAFMFHLSILLPIVIYSISSKIKGLKIPILIFTISVVLSIISFDLNLILTNIPGLDFIIKSRLEDYISNDNHLYKVGFRLDFLLFNLFFAIIGVYLYRNIIEPCFKKNYLTILASYLILSSYFFLMFRVPYSDRFGLLSWILIPLLLSPMLQPALSRIKYKGEYLYILSILLMLLFSNTGGS